MELLGFISERNLPVYRAAGADWVLKVCHPSLVPAERLGAAVGEGRANVCEVRLPNTTEIAVIRAGFAALAPLPDNAMCFVRLGRSYLSADLSCRSAESAVAAELVFSLFARRRDAHAQNREYVDGLPIFFDHHAAFGVVEPHLQSLDTFFQIDDGDAGYVPWWRVWERPEPLTTDEARANANQAIQFVTNFSDFEREAWTAAQSYGSLTDGDLASLVGDAGFGTIDGRAVIAFLQSTRAELEKAVERMINLVQQRWPLGEAALP